jgi:hypothetical protein
MFRKLLQSLSRTPSGRLPTGPLPPQPPTGPLPPRKPSGILGRIVKGESLVANSPEHLCEIHHGMSRDEIAARLKMLYRRYNRSASSLNAATRAEADKMLDAIVAVREKHFGTI